MSKLKILRLLFGMTQIEAAKALNIAQSHYSQIESGKHTPKPQLREKIMKLFRLKKDIFEDEK